MWQLGLCADDRNPGAHLLQCAGGGRRREQGGLSAYWGYASSVVTVITAVLGPILGTLADTKNFKKPIFMLCLFVGVLGCCAMGAARTWLPFLVIFIVAKIRLFGQSWCFMTPCWAM